MRTLFIDLGNTRLKIWLHENSRIEFFDAKEHLQAPADLLLGLSSTLGALKPDRVCVSSVLGAQVQERITTILDHLGAPYEFARVVPKHPLLSTDYDSTQLGVDRWLQLLGASSAADQIIIGAGTALTIDVLKGKQHVGGFITTGVRLTQTALAQGTKQIPAATVIAELPLTAATTTVQAVASGSLLSAAGAIKFCACEHPNAELVLTGGDANLLQRVLADSATPSQLEPDLMLRGLKRYFTS